MVEPQRKAELNGPEEDVAVQLDSEQLPAPAGQQLPGGVVPGNPWRSELVLAYSCSRGSPWGLQLL